ncbi:TetR family transcriptional regulator [Kitasatospora sp. NPDC098663]|uniref:TetR/AcrR family transcriptional regulator n=1 Tax=Kitasatospora sp. NPDC098663 TaxID=3364096 RepID=UPI00381C66FE
MSQTVRKGERTRSRILEAARVVFARHGYERATIRAIAAEADCDKSSVIQYFGTKQQLFREAVDWQVDLGELAAEDPRRQGESYLRSMLADFTDHPDVPMIALLRAAMTSEDAAQLLREKVTAGSIDPVAATLEGPDVRLRAALIGAVMFGVTVQRELLRLPDLAAADLEDVLRLAAPLVQQLLDTPHGAPTGDL